MRRRALLGAMGSGAIAGCLGTVIDHSKGGSRFSIENDPVSDDLPATFSANVLTGATADHAPRIRVVFEYTGAVARTVRFTYPGPFADTLATAADDAELVLKYEVTADDRYDGCWWASTSYDPSATDRRRFDPGERTDVEWVVLTHERSESCYPPGRYRFEDTYHVDGTEYEWGFWLRIR